MIGMLFWALLGLTQGDDLDRAEEAYRTGRYADALTYYQAALDDIEEFRRRTSKGGLTEELVRVNRWIKKYRTLLAQQKKTTGS